MQLKYSIIIPVYNRPEEIQELLSSMVAQVFDEEFEVVIVEDGSSLSSEKVVDQFKDLLKITYLKKENTGPGDSRNFGMQKATGTYYIILDSDVVLPPNYLREVNDYLAVEFLDCFGGPDAAHENFSNLQKAINYSMTSLLTTGGIRGRKKAVEKFQPRSFNMGISREAFDATGGFGSIHPGEDPDLSLRLLKAGFKTGLIPGAVVFHKRRIDWAKFYIQVYKFGLVRPILNSWHPESAKVTYWFPTVFILGLIPALLLLLFGFPFFFILYLLYFSFIGLDAGIKNKSLNIGIAAIIATIIQFTGYGFGFLKSIWKIKFLNLQPITAFPHLFFQNAKQEKTI